MKEIINEMEQIKWKETPPNSPVTSVGFPPNSHSVRDFASGR